MTTQSTLGPLVTLILTLTATDRYVGNVINPSREAVVGNLLFARFVIEVLSLKPARYATPSGCAFRIGTGFER